MARNAKKLDTEGQMAYNASMLRKLRLKLGITQEQLADELGLGIRTVRRFEATGRASQLAERAFKQWAQEVEWQDRVAKEGIQDKRG